MISKHLGENRTETRVHCRSQKSTKEEIPWIQRISKQKINGTAYKLPTSPSMSKYMCEIIEPVSKSEPQLKGISSLQESAHG